MCTAFPCSDYYGSSAPSRRHQPTTDLPTGQLAAGRDGTIGMVPTFTPEPFDGVGAQLCPCNLATITPQAFIVASRPATSPSPGVPRHDNFAVRVRVATQPTSARFELVVCS